MNKITRICLKCQKEFPVAYPSKPSKFCSVTCARAYQFSSSAIERFMGKVDRHGPNGCWLWTGAKFYGDSKTPYGYFWADGTNIPAHRWSYEHFIGPIPNGYHIDHVCRNTLCVNPNPHHIEAVTCKENVLRGIGTSAQNARKTHCIYGHEYDATNTKLDKRGWRKCIKCEKIRSYNRSITHRTLFLD